MTDNRISFAQSAWHTRGKLVEPWTEGMCVSGGRVHWGSRQTVEEVVNADADAVAKTVKNKLLPLMEGRSEALLWLNAERPINMAQVSGLTREQMAPIAHAHNLRAVVVREVFEEAGITPTILAWWGGRNWQLHTTQSDLRTFRAMDMFRELGAFDDYDGCCYRCYSPVPSDDAPWRALDAVVKGGLSASKEVFGDDALHIPTFSWKVHSRFLPHGGPLLSDEAIEQMAEAGNRIVGVAGFWSPLPVLRIMEGVA